MKRTVVIMAGGSGERFWPLSRVKKPKQLLPLMSDKTMIEESIERISSLIPPEDIFIITSKVLLEPLRYALPQIPPENIVAEPHKRNTAPCLALAAAFIAERYGNDYTVSEISIAVLTADHIITPAVGFAETVDFTLGYVEKNPVISTIGIRPARPETGYGYIETDASFDYDNSLPEIKPVARFHEKPDYTLAEEYVKRGNYLWNSGMFFWRLDTFIDSLTKCLPEVGLKIPEMMELYRGQTKTALDSPLESISGLFAAFPDISIDYGLMEKAGNVVVSKALFTWDDIGSWDSLDRIREKDANGNIIDGASALHDCSGSIIINKAGGKEMVFAGIGLENMVVIITDDAVLVTPKNRVQEVKKCVIKIRNEHEGKWL